MTRVAVVGVGRMGRNHVRVYHEMPETELVAVVDQDRQLADECSRMYGVPAYQEVAEMVEKEKPEAVSVVVPTKLHFQVVEELLTLGCHVLVEKPIASTLDDARRMVTLAESQQKVLMVGHIERFNPAVIDLKRRLVKGELGRVFQVHARRLGPFPDRIQDVGVVMDLATHDLDIMRYLTGSEVKRVFSETTQEVHSSFEDLFVGILRFEDHTIGLLEINWLTPTKIRDLYVTGERGMFRLNYITQDLYFFENAEAMGEGWSTLSLLRGVREGKEIKHAIQKREPLRVELESFIQRVIGNGSDIVTGDDAYAALALSLALVESSWTSRAVEVSRGVRDRDLNPSWPSEPRRETPYPVPLPALQTNP